MSCGNQCRYGRRPQGHSDAAKRISDAAMSQWVFRGWDSVGHWMSFSLADGRSNQDLYDTKRDAVTHVDNELRYCFIKLHPQGMTVCEAEIMLEFTRNAVENGFRLADPDAANGGPDIIPRIGTTDVFAQLRALTRKGRGN